jgi:ribosomal protein L11 methyltransferase
MYALHLICEAGEVDLLSGELWRAGTEGIREIEEPDGSVRLIAAFSSDAESDCLQKTFVRFSPHWTEERDTDWIEASERAWPGRLIGKSLFLAPPWHAQPAPPGRRRIIHNPGLACGTGEHPCTQLALEALELQIKPGLRVADIGTGSGILAIAALQLGAGLACGIDTDEQALEIAKQNSLLNDCQPCFVAGSADCLRAASLDMVVANISASVLLSLADDLLRIVRPQGSLILTGFQIAEAGVIKDVFRTTTALERDGWVCLISTGLTA